MKRLEKCPGCFKDVRYYRYNSNWYEEGCPSGASCPIQYHQNFSGVALSQEDNLKEVIYISFYTENFLIYSYFKDTPNPGMSHIYLREFPRDTPQPPAFKVKDLAIDFNNLDALDQKYKNLLVFL